MPSVPPSNPRRGLALGCASAEEFIVHLKEDVKQGYGFVPLVGAGFSAPSGQPIIREIHTYLCECIYLALGGHNSGKEQLTSLNFNCHPYGRPWNPRHDDWPPFDQSDGRKEFRDELTRRMETSVEELTAQIHWPSKTAEALEAKRSILREGIGATAEWRSALLFLSRLTVELRKGVPVIALGAVEQDVIDTFFNTILAGHEPTLGHRMLGLLAGALRLQAILTTNFDDLLERAFAQARNPLTVWPVQMHSSLPALRPGFDHRILIKIHGDRHSLRADYSLEVSAPEDDRWNFLGYFTDQHGRQLISRRLHESVSDLRSLTHVRHLLVIGHSLEERRTVEFIKHAARHLTRGLGTGKTTQRFKVFSLCYSERDVSRLKLLAADPSLKQVDWIWLRAPDFGLFFLQLFQEMRYALPSRGIVFPSASRLAVPLPARIKNSEATTQLSEALKKRRCLIVSAKPEVHGATSLLSQLFTESRNSRVCLWIDANHIGSTLDLFEKILDAYHYQSGRENWKPTRVGLNGIHDAAEVLVSEITHSHREWYIFFNARERPGAHFTRMEESGPLGWLEKTGPRTETDRDVFDDTTDNQDQFIHFWQLVWKKLGRNKAHLKLIMLAPRTKENVKLLAKFTRSLSAHHDKFPEGYGNLKAKILQPTALVRQIARWTRADKTGLRRIFIHRLVAMRRPRYPASLYSLLATSHFKGKQELIRSFLQHLEAKLFIARKPGGFFWVRSDCGRLLMDSLAFTDEEKCKTHEDLLFWYERVFVASEAPSAIFEAVHHAIEAAKSADEKEQGRLMGKAGNLLKIHAHAIQSRGYALANVRILTRYLNEDFSPVLSVNVATFHQQCAELGRCIARELGEDRIAYAMHKKSGSPDGTTGAEAHTGSLEAWLRYWRWCCMLALASRSHHHAPSLAAHGAMRNPRQKARHRNAISKNVLMILREPKELARDLELSIASSSEEVSIQALRLVEELLACEIQRLRTQERTKARPIRPPDGVELHKLINLAESYIRKLNLTGEYFSSLRWCMARFHMHRAALLALCGTQRTDEAWNRAMAVLNDANSCLQFAHSSRHEADLAIVELLRADTKLRQAEACEKQVDQAKALVGDALFFLVRAERVLGLRRRNVWWTTWYFERMLRAIVLSLRLAQAKREPTIPFWGPEVLAAGRMPLADKLLHDAILMIRVDAYRLATVVEAYAQCIIHLGKITDRFYADPIKVIPQDMTKKLRDFALPALTKVIGTRDASKHKKAQVDRTGAQYVSNVLRLAENVCNPGNRLKAR